MSPEKLGSVEFRQDYGVRFSYVAGAMVKAIASTELVIRMSTAGFLSFYGAGGMSLEQIENALQHIQMVLKNSKLYGVNVLANPHDEKYEMELINLLLRYGVNHIEASAFIQITPALIKFRLQGATIHHNQVTANNLIIAKVSRPEIAKLFLNPASQCIIQRMLKNNIINEEEAFIAQRLPIASDICVEADSGGHTDMGVISVLLPDIIRLRDKLHQQNNFLKKVRIGAGGGIGTPESAASAFLLGSDFIVTGSINQCTVEAGTSAVVKDMLQEMKVQDSAYAPAGDMFEMGSKIQVLKRGVLFATRANRLYDLWRTYGALDQIDASTCKEIQTRYLRRSFNDVYIETKEFYLKKFPHVIEKAERDPKAKMALIFRWYFIHTMRLALKGEGERVNYQIHTGPALGAYNQWVYGSVMQNWQARHVDMLAMQLMDATAKYITKCINTFKV